MEENNIKLIKMGGAIYWVAGELASGPYAKIHLALSDLSGGLSFNLQDKNIPEALGSGRVIPFKLKELLFSCRDKYDAMHTQIAWNKLTSNLNPEPLSWIKGERDITVDGECREIANGRNDK